jgi:elongation factor 1-gamma
MLKSKDFAAKSPFKTLPVLETPEGSIAKSNSAIRYLATISGSALYPTAPIHKAEVDQWLEFAHDDLERNLNTWLSYVFGKAPTCAEGLKRAETDVKKFLFLCEPRLKTSHFLVGDSVTLADIAIASALVWGFRAVFDDAFRKPLQGVTKWFQHITSLPEFVRVWGPVKLAKVALKAPAPAAKPVEEVKAAPKKQEAPKPKKKAEDEEGDEEEKQAKKVHPFDLLPPTNFVLDEWKKIYANTPDRRSVIHHFWEKIDKEGWSVWFIKYQKVEGECQVLYLTENLLDGFIHRMEGLRRWSVGTIGIYGNAPAFEILGCLCWRGQVIPPELEDHPQFEFYERRKADLNSDEDQKLINDYWCNLDETHQVTGLTPRTIRLWK